MPGARWSKEDKEKLRREYGGTPTPKLATELGRTPAQVRQAAKRFCELKSHNKLEDYQAAILETHAANMSHTAIAKKLGLPLRTVEFWVRRLNLSPNGWCKESTTTRRRSRMGAWLKDNLGLVWKVVRRLAPICKVEPEDALQEAVMAVLKYSYRYDSKKGKRSTWMFPVARGAILRMVTKKRIKTVQLTKNIAVNI